MNFRGDLLDRDRYVIMLIKPLRQFVQTPSATCRCAFQQPAGQGPFVLLSQLFRPTTGMKVTKALGAALVEQFNPLPDRFNVAAEHRSYFRCGLTLGSQANRAQPFRRSFVRGLLNQGLQPFHS